MVKWQMRYARNTPTVIGVGDAAPTSTTLYSPRVFARKHDFNARHLFCGSEMRANMFMDVDPRR